VQFRFLLGPAGTGKTSRCLAEIRAELKRSPEGPPLLFLAPKQATFQIERQLLGDGALSGYTRLQILSFDRLAQFVLDSLGTAASEILSEEGRVMVLRALLAEKHGELRLFRSTARLPGFAQQLSALLRELQQQRLSGQRLSEIAAHERAPKALRDKLHDVALLLQLYRAWLEANRLHDNEELFAMAAEALRAIHGFKSVPVDAPLAGIKLWLDGFAEMTPQELNLLTAFAPLCESATLAFCLEHEPVQDNASWLSLWTVVAQTCRQCHEALSAVPGCKISIDVLRRDPVQSRFERAPLLAHIEAHWTSPLGARLSPAAAASPLQPPENSPAAHPVRIITCANPESEAVFAAREILRFVREENARFRDCAVLVRTLDGYHDTLRRVFTRYDVPFFLDRRESVAHHPLAELTRFALRTVAFGWRRDDWFGALKTGLVNREEDALDALENEALARGWDGGQWTTPLPATDNRPHRFEPLRQRLIPPFERLAQAVGGKMTGPQLASALNAFWLELGIEETLRRWSDEAMDVAPHVALVHDTVWDQMNVWLENVERAFRTQALTVHEWLPVLEAGLAGLTVGAIPPALDQVLVGAIDRSRNPDLRLALVLGLNETVFPAPPPRAPILTETERTLLAEILSGPRQPDKTSAASTPATFGLSTRQRLAHERYFSYIACTRASERLVLTCAAANSRGVPLNPSPFLTHLENLVPGVFPAEKSERETFSAPDWHDAEHVNEIAAPLIDGHHLQLAPLGSLPALAGVVARAEQLASSVHAESLAREIAQRLYRNPLATSVSALEDFAACPFKFFVKHGLRVQERQEFEIDHRRKGTFQHEVLSEFHARATKQKRQWRDWTPEKAAALMREIGQEKLQSFENGLFNADDARRFTAQVLLQNLERLIATLVTWMKQYQFDPVAVELAFGLEEGNLPGWEIDLGAGRKLLLRGRVDRIDLLRLPENNAALAVVIDYKSSARKVDAVKLHNGLELQLLSYLGWLRQMPAEHFNASKLIPAGVFYVGLRGGYKGAGSRDDTYTDPDATRRRAFQHHGRFNDDFYPHLDKDELGEQFTTHYNSRNAVTAQEFQSLVDQVEQHLKNFGNRILNGVVEIAPYRKGQETACDRCEFLGVCRFDSWTERFRPLEPLPKKRI
jgi:ATP-dependent helicase/nuclease subunit B